MPDCCGFDLQSPQHVLSLQRLMRKIVVQVVPWLKVGSTGETGCSVFAVSNLLIILLITTIPSIFSLHAVDNFSKSEMINVHSAKSFVRSSSL